MNCRLLKKSTGMQINLNSAVSIKLLCISIVFQCFLRKLWCIYFTRVSFNKKKQNVDVTYNGKCNAPFQEKQSFLVIISQMNRKLRKLNIESHK